MYILASKLVCGTNGSKHTTNVTLKFTWSRNTNKKNDKFLKRKKFNMFYMIYHTKEHIEYCQDNKKSILAKHTPASPWIGSKVNAAMRSPFSAVNQGENSSSMYQRYVMLSKIY
jgi:hypothetical protein